MNYNFIPNVSGDCPFYAFCPKNFECSENKGIENICLISEDIIFQEELSRAYGDENYSEESYRKD